MKRDTDVSCEACGYNAPIKPYQRPINDVGTVNLCRLCARSPAGNAFLYQSGAADRPGTATTNHGINSVLDALGKLWPDAAVAGPDSGEVEIGLLQVQVESLKGQLKEQEEEIESISASRDEAIESRDKAHELIEKERQEWGQDLRLCRKRIADLESRLAILNVSIPETTEDPEPDPFEGIEREPNP